MREPSGSTPRALLVSNGHGEDVVGARLAAALRKRLPELQLHAFPLVGLGDPYTREGVRVVGPRRDLPSGGLLMHSLPLFLADLRAGFLSLTASQLRYLVSERWDALIVVGDIYAQLLAALVRSPNRFAVQTLVSARHGESDEASSPNRLFMERITLPERLLMKLRSRVVFVRDEVTEDALRALGVPNVRFLGNPIADGLAAGSPLHTITAPAVIGLLPGSREYRYRSLPLMMAAFELLADAGRAAAVAWLGDPPPLPDGWNWSTGPQAEPGLLGVAQKGVALAYFYEGRFADVLHASRLVIGTAGTANEQAVALARPVVGFPVPPFYSRAFLVNQQRLLGPALAVAEPFPEAVAAAARAWLEDPARADLAGRQGMARIGAPGGSERIAEEIAGLLARSERPDSSTASYNQAAR